MIKLTKLDYIPGQVYNRRRDIHARFGGQEQSGIITPSKVPAIFIITGHDGGAHGYHDRFRADGIVEYYGEGQRGDMEFVRGNRAIRDHQENGKSLLLFEKQSAGLMFVGPMRLTSYRVQRGVDSEGNTRGVIVFLLERT